VVIGHVLVGRNSCRDSVERGQPLLDRCYRSLLDVIERLRMFASLDGSRDLWVSFGLLGDGMPAESPQACSTRQL